MAKGTESNFASWAAGYVEADHIGMDKDTYVGQLDASSICGMIDKVGKQFTIKGNFVDEFPELSGESLPLGKTVEEYFRAIVVPHAVNGTVEKVPFAAAAYSIPFDRQEFKLFNPQDEFEQACTSMETAADLIDSTVTCLADSKAYARRTAKLDLLGKAIDMACAVSEGEVGSETYPLVRSVAKPTDTASGSAAILAIKEDKEKSMRPGKGGLNQELIGGTSDLALYVLEGVMPNIAVNTLAGAIHSEELGMNVTIHPVESFGDLDNTGVWALLVDTRGIKLYNAADVYQTRPGEDSDGRVGYITTNQFRDTGVVSKYCFIKVYKPAA